MKLVTMCVSGDLSTESLPASIMVKSDIPNGEASDAAPTAHPVSSTPIATSTITTAVGIVAPPTVEEDDDDDSDDDDDMPPPEIPDEPVPDDPAPPTTPPSASVFTPAPTPAPTPPAATPVTPTTLTPPNQDVEALAVPDAAMCEKYCTLFTRFDPRGSGVVAGAKVKAILTKARLETPVLAEIWKLADNLLGLSFIST
jgi:hypothetical protein